MNGAVFSIFIQPCWLR